MKIKTVNPERNRFASTAAEKEHVYVYRVIIYKTKPGTRHVHSDRHAPNAKRLCIDESKTCNPQLDMPMRTLETKSSVLGSRNIGDSDCVWPA